MILIPVKNLSNAKQRLAPLLEAESRTALAQAMLRDVLETVHSWRQHGRGDFPAALVTSDSYAQELGSGLGFELIRDETNPGETGAIEMATRLCEERQISKTLVIPGDIPLLAEWELEEIVSKAPLDGSLLVPAADGRGTNAAFRSPAGLFPLRFGNDSFKPHLAAARATGKPCVVISLPGIALDVDRPHDLQQLQFADGDGHAQRLVRRWDLSELPMAANERAT
jgi:2-phospho-L-lactate guanylyltransferase